MFFSFCFLGIHLVSENQKRTPWEFSVACGVCICMLLLCVISMAGVTVLSDVSYLTWNRGPRWLPCPSGGPVQIRGLVMCRCVCVDGSVHTAGTSSPTAVTALCYHGSVLCLGGRSGHPAGQPLPTLGRAEFAGDTRLWRGSPGANTGRHPRGGRVSPWFGKGGTSGPPPSPCSVGNGAPRVNMWSRVCSETCRQWAQGCWRG